MNRNFTRLLAGRASWRERIVHWILRLWGKQKWSPYVRSLRHLGRQAPVAFPPELLDQGLGLLLTGLSNSVALQGHANWVLPFWAERQLRPDSPDFIPSGVNVLTMNLSRRNWTSIGNHESVREAMIDQAGMLTPGPFEPSLLPFLKINDKLYCPPRMNGISQRCLPIASTVLETVYPILPTWTWKSRHFALRFQGQEWIAWENVIRYDGVGTQEFCFGIGLRPYNVLSFAPVFRLRYKKQFWKMNRKPFAFFPQEPDRVMAVSRHQLDPLLDSGAEIDPKGSSASGWMVGQAEWQAELSTGQELRYWVFVPVHPEMGVLSTSKWKTEGLLESALEELTKVTPLDGVRLTLPIEDLQNDLELLRRRWHVFDDVKHFCPGTFFYHSHWIRDSAFLAMAFDDWGQGDRVEMKISTWLRGQLRSGEFRSHAGEWDSTGQAIFVIIRHYRLQNDLQGLRRVMKFIEKCLHWIVRTRKKNPTTGGLLPAGFSAEHFGPNDHYFWDNLWSLAGLESWIEVLEILGAESEIAFWQKELDDYAQVIHGLCEQNSDRWQKGMASSPYRMLDASAIGNLVSASPLDLKCLNMEWLRPTAHFLMDHHLSQELFYQPISHTGLNVYLTAQLARALQYLWDDRWWELFRSMRAHASQTLTWPEAIHPRTGGGCMGDGDHGWAMVEYMALIRNCLLREQNGVVYLLPNMPLEFWHSDDPLQWDSFALLSGELSLSLHKLSSKLVLSWSLKRFEMGRKDKLCLVLPIEIDPILSSVDVVQLSPTRRGIWVEDQGQMDLFYTSKTSAFAINS